jgi:hypothetical protein
MIDQALNKRAQRKTANVIDSAKKLLAYINDVAIFAENHAGNRKLADHLRRCETIAQELTDCLVRAIDSDT